VRVDWSLQTLSVDAVTGSWANRSIRPNPEYQRGLQWKRRQQQLLIDSIFRGYPLPRFYFERKASKDPLGTAVVSLDVIDGQQRIIALTQFRNDEWPLLEPEKLPLPPAVRRLPCPWGGMTFSGLDSDLRVRLLTLTLPVVLIDDAETDEVRDLFIRLQAGTPGCHVVIVDRRPTGMSRRAVRKNQLFSLFIFPRDVLVGPADFGRAPPKIASRFWAEDDADAYEPKGGRLISPTTIAEHASWFRRTKMNGLVLPELDARRLSHEQRREIWDRYGGKCGICGQAITNGEEEYDRVIPWISGGRTEPDNGRPVHRA
jgi:Protein of unknown function DUF262